MATKKRTTYQTPLRAAGKRVQTFGGVAATSVTKYGPGGAVSLSGTSRQPGKAVGKLRANPSKSAMAPTSVKKTGIARALSNPGAAKRSSKATANLTKKRRGY